jgi:hypothetical protein
MAYRYTDSVAGNNSNNGTTRALANATVAGSIADSSVGDFIALNSAHAETTGSGLTLSMSGTPAAPTYIASVDYSAEPPPGLIPGASISMTGADILAINGNGVISGATLQVGSGTNSGLLFIASSSASQFQRYENGKVRVIGTGSFGGILIGRDSAYVGAKVEWENYTVRFAASNQGFRGVTSCWFEWRNKVNGGSATAIESGGTAPAALFKCIGEYDSSSTGRSAVVDLIGLDLSNGGSAMNICGNLAGGSRLTCIDCIPPGSWSGRLAATVELGAIAVWVSPGLFIHETAQARVTNETTIVMSGGYTVDGTPTSWKVITTSLCGPGSVWRSPEMVKVITSVGSPIDIEVEIEHDSATPLTDAEVWLDVVYLGTTSSSQGSVITDRVATILATPANQASSSSTWTTTGHTNPNKQTLKVTCTPLVAGPALITVCAAKASKTFFINPLT